MTAQVAGVAALTGPLPGPLEEAPSGGGPRAPPWRSLSRSPPSGLRGRVLRQPESFSRQAMRGLSLVSRPSRVRGAGLSSGRGAGLPWFSSAASHSDAG